MSLFKKININKLYLFIRNLKTTIVDQSVVSIYQKGSCKSTIIAKFLFFLNDNNNNHHDHNFNDY